MKEIRIFLASSYELEPDRARIGNLIRELNEKYEKKFIHLKLVKWEDLDAFYNSRGKQLEYDFQIRNCELFIALFWHIAGRHTAHEVEVARETMPADHIFIFHKTAEFRPDHEGSEDEKRFLEEHPDENLEELTANIRSYLKEQNSSPYADFAGLKAALTEKLDRYCLSAEVKEEEKRPYSSGALQIHIVASPEAEPDLARLGDLVRYLDENSKHSCRIRLVPETAGSDMFVSMCHTSAPDPIPQEIRNAIECSSGNNGRPRIYFCMKYIPEKDKEKSLQDLELRIGEILKHYPDRYTQASEMKLHFLLQLENLKTRADKEMLVVEDGLIWQRSGESKFPLMSCEEMHSLCSDPAYQQLKADQDRLLAEIETLKKQDRESDEDVSGKIYELHRKLSEVRQQINDKQNGYFRLLGKLEEMVGREQDETICRVRELVGKGLVEEALKLLPDSRDLRRQREERKQHRQAEDLRAYEVCELTIGCLYASNRLKNRDEIFKLFELLIDIAAEDLHDGKKEADACSHYGGALIRFSFLEKALDYHERALAIRLQMLGENHPDTADSYNAIGIVWSDRGCYNKALDYHEKALAIQLQVLGENHRDTANSFNNIGSVCYRKGCYARALDNYQKSLAINLRIFGENHRNTAIGFYNIGLLWSRKGRYDKALENHQKSLAIRLQIFGENHPDTAMSYNSIGLVLKNNGNYDGALEYFQKALAIHLQVLGENHPYTALIYTNFGEIFFRKGDSNNALAYFRKALAIQLQILGENHPETASSYQKTGAIYSNKGDYDKALECYRKTLAIQLQTLGENHPDTASCYGAVGLVWLRKGNYHQALVYFQKSLTIKLQVLGENHPATAASYNQIGAVFFDLGNCQAALENHRKALSIRLAVFPEQHPEIARSYSHLGKTYAKLGDLQASEENYRKAYEIAKAFPQDRFCAGLMEKLSYLDRSEK